MCSFYFKWYVLLLYVTYHPFFEAGYSLSLQILRREVQRWFILLQMYGSLNTKIPNEAVDWHLVTETLYIRTAGWKCDKSK